MANLRGTSKRDYFLTYKDGVTDDSDWIYGDDGNDQINGLGGDDRLQGGRGADDLFGGDGFDTADYTDSVLVNASGDVDSEMTIHLLGSYTVEASWFDL
jgi:Ca2+-binding RTX toxin-like protein